ncbi:MAG: hypothetical protein PUE72_00205 [Lachnospiraceae bacterium]|nr:hypothetical protein [Lachnospiraceae bacterium]
MPEKHMIRCNACGKEQAVLKHGAQEEFLKIQKTWGYFSEKDGETHRFSLCEVCYDRIRKQFVLPVEILECEP